MCADSGFVVTTCAGAVFRSLAQFEVELPITEHLRRQTVERYDHTVAARKLVDAFDDRCGGGNQTIGEIFRHAGAADGRLDERHRQQRLELRRKSKTSPVVVIVKGLLAVAVASTEEAALRT